MDEIIQGSPDWFAVRLGKVTASRVGDVIARTKSGPAASRTNYLAQLVAERLTGEVAATFSNAAMAWGTDTEPQARAAYEFHRDAEVEQVGFISHPTILMSGCSPDGLIGTDGLIEIKCPNTATHIETVLGGGAAAKHGPQIHWQLACTGRAWCDFVSFDPRLPEEMRLHIERVHRDEAVIADLEREVIAFLAEVDAKVGALERRFRPARAA